MKTMIEVLMAHWSASTHSDRKPFVDKCDGCGEVIFSWGDPTVADGSAQLAAHQSAALSAAGFGLVSDAKREALRQGAEIGWDAAVSKLTDEDGAPLEVIQNINPYRKASNDDQ